MSHQLYGIHPFGIFFGLFEAETRLKQAGEESESWGREPEDESEVYDEMFRMSA